MLLSSIPNPDPFPEAQIPIRIYKHNAKIKMQSNKQIPDRNAATARHATQQEHHFMSPHTLHHIRTTHPPRTPLSDLPHLPRSIPPTSRNTPNHLPSPPPLIVIMMMPIQLPPDRKVIAQPVMILAGVRGRILQHQQ